MAIGKAVPECTAASGMSGRKKELWTNDEVAMLKELHGEIPLREIARRIRRTPSAIRGKITKLGISKLPVWSEEEIKLLRSAYTRAGAMGVVNLTALSKRIGRHKSNVCRKARQLGLHTNLNRSVVEERKIRKPMFDNKEDLRVHMSKSAKRWLEDNKHPRGMLGKHHSEEVKTRLSEASTAWNNSLTEDEKAGLTEKAMVAKIEKYGSLAPKIKRGSWKAGWREFGGKRNYYRSRWEANYGRYLEWLKQNGEIKNWEHEPETFWFENIKRGVRSYLPDFRVWENDGSTALHEVKGWMDARSKTTLSRMKKYYPEQPVLVVDGKAYQGIKKKVSRMIVGWE